jgi:hypothetical protein
MEEEKILENITKSISERLKVPIITTYACVLLIYNWDILFYLFFEDSSASIKIQSIKSQYGTVYYERIFTCLTISVLLIVLFTVLNTLINFCLKSFYRKDKEIISEIESFEKVNFLTEQLSKSIDDIKKLNSQIENLKNVNENLSSKNLKIDIPTISQKDYDSLLGFLNTQANKEKLLFSLKEFIDKIRTDKNISNILVYNTATYEQDMRQLIDFLIKRNLIKMVRRRANDNSISTYEGFEMGTSFKDFLKMEI